jgi:hypothetical protein
MLSARVERRRARRASEYRDTTNAVALFSLPYEVQAFPWSGLAPCARASASDI